MKAYLRKSSCIFVVILLVGVLVIASCASEESAAVKPAGEQEMPILFNVRSPQEVVYDGQAHGIAVQYNGEIKLEIEYYSSVRDRTEDRRGSKNAPVKAGTYYVRVKRPAHKSIPAKEFLAELRILKRPVKILTQEAQQAVYNGEQKRIQVEINPPVTIAYSYFPEPEMRELAKLALNEGPGGTSSKTLADKSRQYKRVDRAPVEQGTYYVWLYYPGDENHESATASVDFTIKAPERK